MLVVVKMKEIMMVVVNMLETMIVVVGKLIITISGGDIGVSSGGGRSIPASPRPCALCVLKKSTESEGFLPSKQGSGASR